MITYYSNIMQIENRLSSFYFPSLGENKSTSHLHGRPSSNVNPHVHQCHCTENNNLRFLYCYFILHVQVKTQNK